MTNYQINFIDKILSTCFNDKQTKHISGQPSNGEDGKYVISSSLIGLSFWTAHYGNVYHLIIYYTIILRCPQSRWLPLPYGWPEYGPSRWDGLRAANNRGLIP